MSSAETVLMDGFYLKFAVNSEFTRVIGRYGLSRRMVIVHDPMAFSVSSPCVRIY